MKNFKWIITVVLILFLCGLFLVSAFAEETKEMVYADRTTQDEIYPMLNDPTFDYYALLRNKNLTVVKESIMPIYTASVLDFAESGEFRVVPLTQEPEGGNVYIAKVVTADGELAGNLSFWISNNTAHGGLFEICNVILSAYPEGGQFYPASCSYADHAERIQKIFNYPTFIPVDKVKFISLDRIAEGFLIQNEETFYIVPLGVIKETQQTESDYVLTMSDLAELASAYAEDYYQTMEEKAKWEKEHPGEQWSYTGGGFGSPVVSIISEVNNINNIFEYLGISEEENLSANEKESSVSEQFQTSEIEPSISEQSQNSEAENSTPSGTETTNTPLIIAVIVLAAAVVALIISLFAVSKKKKG